MKAFTFLCTHYAPTMHLCVPPGNKGRTQDELSFVCHSIMSDLVVSNQEDEDDDAPPRLLLPPDEAVSETKGRNNNMKAHDEMTIVMIKQL